MLKTKNKRKPSKCISTLFVVAKDEDVDKIWWNKERSQLAENFKVFDAPNVTDEVLSWLYTVSADKLYDAGFGAKQRVRTGDQHGPWLFSVPNDFIKALGSLDKTDTNRLAEHCEELEMPELEGWSAKDLAELIAGLTALSKQAASENKSMFFLMDASTASDEDALDCKARQLCLTGDELLRSENYSDALQQFEIAGNLLSTSDSTSTLQARVLSSMGNANFYCGNYDEACGLLTTALKVLDPDESPAGIYFALAKSNYESGDREAAQEEFQLAYLIDGPDMFTADEPKYFEFLKSTLSDLGKRAKGYNDALLYVDLHMQRELDEELADKMRELCIKADDLSKDRKFPDSINMWWQAFDLLPEEDEDERLLTGVWIVAAVGNVNFLNKDFVAGADNLRTLGGHPFSFLRLGQCHFELGDMDAAADGMARAYMLAGREIFENEDPKYLEFLSTVLVPPAGQDKL